MFEILCKDPLITKRDDFINNIVDQEIGVCVKKFNDLTFEIAKLTNNKDKNIDEKKVK